jgi:hypothetical protein
MFQYNPSGSCLAVIILRGRMSYPVPRFPWLWLAFWQATFTFISPLVNVSSPFLYLITPIACGKCTRGIEDNLFSSNSAAYTYPHLTLHINTSPTPLSPIHFKHLYITIPT